MSVAEHRVWGQAEALSCYSSSNSTATARSKSQPIHKPRRLPEELIQHLADSVAHDASSDTNSDRTPSSHGRTRVGLLFERRGRGLSPEEEPKAYATNTSKYTPDAKASSDEQPALGKSANDMSSHQNGGCTPCLYVNSSGGCRDGTGCRFCHEPHLKKSRPRPSKSTRQQCKSVAKMLEGLSLAPQQTLEAANKLGVRSPYMRAILQGKRRELEETLGVHVSAESPAVEAPRARPPASTMAPAPEQLAAAPAARPGSLFSL